MVKLTSPGNGTTYKVGASIPVKATASGVKYVQIYYKNVNNASDWGQIGPTYVTRAPAQQLVNGGKARVSIASKYKE